VKLYAHRGSHRGAVENTLEAFSLAVAEGADGVELDVRGTRDGQVVVFHDDDLARLASDRREVAALDQRDLPSVGGAPIPTLDEALDLVLAAGLEVNVEVKGAPEQTAAVLARRGERDRGMIIVSSFLAEALDVVRARLPSVRLALLVDRLGPVVPLTYGGLHPHHELCTAERVERWRSQGLFVNAWTVNDPGRGSALAAMGLDGLVTDHIPALRETCTRVP